MKKIISMILCVLMVVSMLPMSALALDLPELDVLEDVVEAVEEEDESVEEAPAEEEVEEPVEEPEPEQEPEAEVKDPIESTEEEIKAEEEPVGEESSESEDFEIDESDITVEYTAPVLYASRIAVVNPNGVTGQDIVKEARKWANVSASYFSDYKPWPQCIAWRTGYTTSDHTYVSFDCSGFVCRVLNDLGLRGESPKDTYVCVLRDKYGSNFISSDSGYLGPCYGDDITSAVQKAKKGDYSDLQPGDVLYWIEYNAKGEQTDCHYFIYAGLNSSGQPTTVEFTQSGKYLDRVVTSYYWSKVQSGTRFVESFQYTDSWPCDLTFEIKTSCNAWTMPGSDSTYPDSEKVTSSKLAVGTKLVATEIYENTAAGHYWYKTTVNGEPAYVYVPYTKNATQNWNVSVSGVKKPTEVKLTDSFNIGGIVKTGGSLINSIRAFVYPGTTYQGGAYVICSDTVNPNSTTYDLSKETNSTLIFDDITSTGYYTYIVHTILKSYTLNGYDVPEPETKVVILDDTKSYFQVVAAGHSHSYSKIVVAATCEAQGYTQYTCSCGASYKDNYTNATGHSYSSKVTQVATCTKSGVVTYTCSSCGDSYESTTSPTGHSYISETIGGNCVEPATTVYTCEVCGDSYSEMADNNWSEWSTTYPSGVDSDAIESRVEYRYKVKEHTTSTSSSLSGWDLEDEVSEWGDYGAWSSWSTTKATASDSKQVETRTAYHYYYYKCASCGAHMHGYGTNACYTWAGGCGGTIKSSSYTKGYYATPYSSAKDWHGTGVYYITDSSAGKVFAYTSSSSSHYVAPVTQYRYRTRALETTYYFYRWGNWSDWSATYVAASDDTKVETRTVYRYDLYSTAEHDWDSGVVTTPAGPGTSGVKTYTCNVCGETKTESIAALPNEYTVTYNANGGTGAPAAQTKTHGEDLTLSTTKPTRSGYTFLGWSTVKTAEIAMFEPGKTYSLADKDIVLYAVWEHSDHSYMESITKQPTCTSTGVKTYTCSVCGDSYEETLNATDHKTELRNAAEATCTKGGYTGDLYCTVCKTTVSYGQEVAASGHNEVTDAAVAATCTKTGLTEGSHCSVCGTVTVAQKTVAKIAHTWDSGKVTKEPALNVDGVITYTCTACGGTKTEKISAISADINSDGTSNAFDLVALMKHIVGAETAKNTDALDVNGDSKVDILDVVRLVRYLA